MFNLLVNSAQAIKINTVASGHINISTSISDGLFKIEISDNGGGIFPDDIEKVMRPFFSTKSDGTGLGLSICNRLISKLKGTLIFANKYPIGCSFAIVLPV